MNPPVPLAGAVALTHLGVIRARGADATKFLQGQLTNDVAALDDRHARLAGFCSAKGRLQASFIVWKNTDDDVLLVCARSVLAATLKRLSMFVLRAQCKLSDASEAIPLWGFVGSTAVEAIGSSAVWDRVSRADATLVRLPDAAGMQRALLAPNDPSWAPHDRMSATLDDWRWLEVQSGVPLIEASTADQFVPQMLNYEVLGGVDFQKGCYPGQEIVARSQYRGTIKRRMFLFDSGDALAAGDEVFHAVDPAQPAGMVVNAAANPAGGFSALVEAKLAVVDEGDLHLARVDGPVLRRQPLPYSLPAP